MERRPSSSIRYDDSARSRLARSGAPNTDAGVLRRASVRPPETDGRSVKNITIPGWPAAIVGLPVKVVIAHLPALPDQESDVTLWLLIQSWIGQSYPMHTPKSVVRVVLDLVADIQAFGLAMRSRGPKSVIEPMMSILLVLMSEYGVFQVLRTLIGCCYLIILLNHKALGAGANLLFELAAEASQALERWVETCIREYGADC